MAPKKAVKSSKAEAAKAEPAKAEAPQKRKAESTPAAAEEPPSKDPKVEEVVEQEKDAKDEKRPCLKGTIGFTAKDTTLNVVPTMGGRVLGALTEGAISSLVAGARANVGLKAGRYVFEVKVLEMVGGAASHGKGGGAPTKPVLRVGFSTDSAPLVLGSDSEDSVYFDADGGFFVGQKRQCNSKKCFREQVLAVVLNLDQKSPNKNTVSIFGNGQRLIQPQALPEDLIGKALFPHITFRSMKVLVNWGPQPLKELPFVCRSIGYAAQADTAATAKSEPKDGKYEVVFPVGFPDEGTFDWLDGFMAKHPQHTELSDRMVTDWAKASGLKFGLGSDDRSTSRVLRTFAGLVPRNYVVMDVKDNLIPKDRQASMKLFGMPHYKKIAHVVMGEPKADFKRQQQAGLLKAKQEKVTAQWKAAKAEKQRKKVAKELEQKRKQRLEELAAKRKADEKKKAEALAAKKAAEEKKDDDKKEEDGEKAVEKTEEKAEEAEKKEEEKTEEKTEEKAAEEEEDEDMEPPEAELTEEEQAKWFAPKLRPDIKTELFNRVFASFALPEKAEGFDDIKYEWQQAAGSKAYLQDKMVELKKTLRVEDLAPGLWFRDLARTFTMQLAAWQKKQQEYKESEAGKAEAAKRKAAEAKGDSFDDNSTVDGDIFSVSDVLDIGNGQPLFKDFVYEDWALLNLRFELFALQAAFKKDVNDADRPGVSEVHFPFYFQKYFKKTVNFKAFGVADLTALVKLVKDTVTLEDGVLGTPLEIELEDIAALLKQSELSRRERQRRLYAGDETARLKLTHDALRSAAPPAMTRPVLAKPAIAKPGVAKPGVTKPVAAKVAVTAPAAAKAAITAPAAAKAGVTAPAVTKPNAAAKPAGAQAAVTAPAVTKPTIVRPGAQK